MNLPQNMGSTDRIVRIVLALAFAAGAIFFFNSNLILAVVFAVFGIVMLATSFMGFCPLYLPIKFTTNKKN